MKKLYRNTLAIAALIFSIAVKGQTPSFTITNLSPSFSITCATPAVNLTAASNYTGGSVTYSWASNNNIQNGANVFLSLPGIYTVTAFASPGVSSSQTISIGINTLTPSSVVSPTIQNITCNPASVVTVSAGANMPAVHVWVSPTGGTVIANPALTSTYIPGGTGTYTYYALNPVNGCMSAKTVTVVSSQGFPTYSLTSSLVNFTLGCGTNSILTVNITNASTFPTPGGAVSYTVLAPGVTPGPPGSMSSYTINTPGLYTALVRDNTTLCETRTPFTVLQNTFSPAITLSASSATICSGSSVSLTASGANTYTFNPAVTNGTVAPLSTTSYSVSGTSTVTGCTSQQVAVTVSVLPLPSLSVNPSSTVVCQGNSLSLTGAGADTYSWSGGIVNGQPFTPTSNSSFTLTGTNTVTGCSNSTVYIVVVTPAPTVSISASSATTCLLNSVTLTPSGASTYSWSTGVINNVVYPNVTTTYTLTGYSANGCSNTAVQTISVLPSPSIAVTSSEPVFCAGMSTTLTATGATSYSWNGIANGNTISVSPLTTTFYGVTGVAPGSCLAYGGYSLQVNTSTSFNYTVNGMSTQLAMSGTGCNSFMWDFGNGTTNTINPNPVVTYTAQGIYGICLKCTGLPNGCTRCFNITVPGNAIGGVGIEEIKIDSPVKIYPNPSNGYLNVELDVQSENNRIVFFNYLGQSVGEQILSPGKNAVLLDLPKGLYYYRLLDNNSAINSGQLIIE